MVMFLISCRTKKYYNVFMEQILPTSIKFQAEELKRYQAMSERLGLPFATFVKLVLRQSAEEVYKRMSGMTFDVKQDDKRQ